MTSPLVPAPRVPGLRPAAGRHPMAAARRIATSAPQMRAALAHVAAAPADLLMWLMAAVVCMYVWRFQGLIHILAVAKVTILAMAMSILVFANDHHPMRTIARIDSRIFRAILGLLLLIMISTPFSVYRRVSFEFLTQDFVLNLAMMVIVGASVRSAKDVDWHIRAFIFGCAVYTFRSIVASRSERLGGIGTYDANDLAALLVFSLPLAVYLVRGTRNRLWQLAGTGFLGMMLFALVKTQSRGGFIGLLVVGLFILVAYRTIPARVRIGVALGGTLVVGAAAGQEFWDRMATILNPQEDYNYSGKSVSGRMEVWKRGLGYMLSNPVGVGPFAFPHAEGRSTTAQERLEEGSGFKWSAAHNSFIQVGAELGVLGLVLMVYAIWSAMSALRRIGKVYRADQAMAGPAQALFGSYLGFAVAGSFVSFAYSSFLFWLFGISLGLIKLAHQPAEGQR